eukprot:5152115-Amphidinium_carterae.1
MLSEILEPNEVGSAEIVRVESSMQKADALTKPLVGEKFDAALKMMNVCSPPTCVAAVPGLESFEDAVPPAASGGA